MRRVPELPAGPHKLLAILAEPLKQKENLFSLENQEVSDNLQEFEDWVWLFLHIDVHLMFMPDIFISMYNVSLDQNICFCMAKQHEYYSLDATYRNWLKVEMQNAAVSPETLSAEENDQAVAAAKETLELAFLLLKSKFITGCIIWCTSMKICFPCF
jgi:nuclear pore complex protein Nup107